MSFRCSHLAFSMMNEHSYCSGALWSTFRALLRTVHFDSSCCSYVLRAMADRPRLGWGGRDWAVIINIIVMGSIPPDKGGGFVHQMMARGIIYRWGEDNLIIIRTIQFQYLPQNINIGFRWFAKLWEIWNAQIGKYVFSVFTICFDSTNTSQLIDVWLNKQ